jgi:DNA-directed RNA polymerase subunit A"
MDGQYGKSEKQVFPEDRNMEFLKLDKKVFIPTCDKDGNMSWGEMTAVTRHDTSELLYEFTTKSGRKVVVADSESMLIWNDKSNIFEKKQSKDIKLNESVPMTASLPEPPVINTYVDMVDYFPKTEYIYGSEYIEAMKQIEIAKNGEDKLPKNWWKDNNGKIFTLPYKDSSSLERKTNNIKEGFVYSKSKKGNCLITDKFELNYDNGLFIGLYLAEGSTHNSRQVSIANTDRDIKDFTIKWFNKNNIHNREDNYSGIDEITKKNKISESTVGNSAILAKFLTTIVGHGAKNKFVPSFAYTAPTEFITGLLNGYFSGDGNVQKNLIRASSISEKLIEGISVLCSRIGVFSKISAAKRTKNGKEINTEYVIAINGQWGNTFSEKINLILKVKNDKLKKINNTRLHCNYPEYNDVVQDKIIKIEILNQHTETKLYDVTVPSTWNFCIANGLNLSDTSETGYIF